MELFENVSFHKIFLFIFIAFYFFSQVIYIDADTPISLAIHAGTYSDEGYKTLDARNLALFGETHWNKKDEYSGWIGGSPITVYFNFLVFKLFGVSLMAARLGNLLIAIGCLVLFYMTLNKIYDEQTAFLGLIICAVSQIFFFYSRLALFEFKMMFFLLLGLYFMFLVKQNYLYLIPTIFFWVAAYYCKPAAQVFFISVICYLILTCKNGLILKALLRKRYLIFTAATCLILFLLLQYAFIYHRDYYDSVYLFNRHYRSPIGALLYYVTQLFFTKNPILTFLAAIYIGYIIILLVENNIYNKYDVFFVVWLITGTAIFAFVSFQQLGYYVYVLFPLIAITVRSILAFPPIWKRLFQNGNVWVKGSIFVLSTYLLVIHVSFLRFMPIRTWTGWNIHALKLLVAFSMIIIPILSSVYILLLKKSETFDSLYRVLYRMSPTIFVLLILGIQIIPITKWAVGAKYELVAISEKINELDDNVILVGDWAPQVCLNTAHKVLYLSADMSQRWSRNLNNLDEVRPNYLVITSGINDHIFLEFNFMYPGVAKEVPRYEFKYAGRTILFYELDFRRVYSRQITERTGAFRKL